MQKTKEDFEKIDEILSKRSSEQLKPLFNEDREYELSDEAITFLIADCDLGVSRNGGRRGAKFAPEAILNVFKKMAEHESDRKHNIHKFLKSKVISNKLASDFDNLQRDSSEKIYEQLQQNVKNFVHLGGGHDHIYPLLKALSRNYKKISVLNIDAHLDTRVDDKSHSGTPFRQFAKEFEGKFNLIQLGIHPFANTQSTYKKLEDKHMSIHTFDELRKETDNFTVSLHSFLNNRYQFDKDELVVLSLDCDAIDSATMEAVSAVNHHGIPLHAVKEIFKFYQQLPCENKKVYGIYEYNPVYDNLSQKGARALASMLYELLF